MGLISTILLAVVLAVQVMLCIVFAIEQRHSNRRYSALLQYIDRRMEDVDCEEAVMNAVMDAATEKMSVMKKNMDETLYQHTNEMFEFKRMLTEKVMEYAGKVDTLALDYTEAQQAANKVNDFASSISSIFDYDPVRALQRGRNKEAH